MTSMDKRGKGWSWTTMTTTETLLWASPSRLPESASKLRLVQSADVDILGQGGILSFLAHMHRQTDHRSQATTDRCFE